MANEIVNGVVIREATPNDEPAIAKVHVAAWNATYGPFLMNGPSVTVREQQWRAAFTNPDASWFCFVSMWLYGDARNPSAKAWLALGAVKTDNDPGNGNYGWTDLNVLVERCESKD